MIGIVIPSHNEEQMLGACLKSVMRASRHPALRTEEVSCVVVLDACTDGSAAVARRFPVQTLEIDARNVGVARAEGAKALLQNGARWLAFTDADSHVARDWLAAHLSLGGDAVCGTVEVADWSGHDPETRRRYEMNYQDRDGHRHIHGANLSVSAAAYVHAGGFPPIAAHEDVHLVSRLLSAGSTVHWSARPRVRTSSRIANRVQGGFGGHLQKIAAALQPLCTSGPLT